MRGSLTFYIGSSKRPGAVLPTKLSLKLESSPRRHQALEFFEPVEDEAQLGGLQFLLADFDHQEALTVRCDVNRAKTRG